MAAGFNSRPRWLTLGAAAFVSGLACAAAASQESLTTLRGVICYASPDQTELFVQDNTRGVLLRTTSRPEFDPAVGQFVEAQGKSSLGPGGPELLAAHLRLLGEAPLPSAMRADYNQMAAGDADCRYTQFTGVVQSVEANRDNPVLDLLVAGPTGRLTARIRNYHLGDCQKLIDAVIRVSGVCFREYDAASRLSRVTLRVSGMGEIAVACAAPADPFATEACLIGRLPQWAATSSHRAKVAGVVSVCSPGREFYIQDESGGVRVETSQRTPLRTGDLVEVLGFPVSGDAPVLENAVFNRTGHRPGLSPARLTSQDLRGLSRLRQWVELEGVIASPGRRTGPGLCIVFDETLLAVSLVSGEDLPAFLPHTRVRVTGVLERKNDTGFEVVAGSIRDIRTLRPGFQWGSLILAVGLLSATGLAFFFWLRRTLNRAPGLHHSG